MNYSISVLFRLIPLVMGAICLGLGLYVLDGPLDANHFVAGHVLVSLAAFLSIGSASARSLSAVIHPLR